MRTERFGDLGELPYHLQTLWSVALRLAAFLLYVLLSVALTVAAAPLELAEKTRVAFRSVVRQSLLVALGPPRVGLQIGHDRVSAHPTELQHLRGNTGGFAGGYSEVAINRGVAAALKRALEAQGVAVEVLAATPPPSYHADLLLALHADSVGDGSTVADRTGYKSAIFDPPRSRLEPQLKRLVDAHYLRATGLPDDTPNTTSSMTEYYAFNFRTYTHAVHPATPALIVELGYLSNTSDLTLLLEPERVADALAGGVMGFLASRNRVAWGE